MLYCILKWFFTDDSVPFENIFASVIEGAKSHIKHVIIGQYLVAKNIRGSRYIYKWLVTEINKIRARAWHYILFHRLNKEKDEHHRIYFISMISGFQMRTPMILWTLQGPCHDFLKHTIFIKHYWRYTNRKIRSC